MGDAVIVHKTYECPICGIVYKSQKVAQACLDQAPPPDRGIKVGDIVTCCAGFGWYSGDKAWVSNPDVREMHPAPEPECPNGDSNCFSPCCSYMFYYVVGVICMEQPERYAGLPLEEPITHRRQYHVHTKAMKSKDGYRSGYTYDVHHIAPHRVEPQPVLSGAEEFISHRSRRLL